MSDDGDTVQPYEMPDIDTPLSNPLGELAGIDWSSPNIARMYDWMMGGSANFAADRHAAEAFEAEFPWIGDWAQANRAFLRRAVRTLVLEHGIEQFLDLGSGVPTVGNVHEIAQRENPAARVAYVEIEPIAVYHARHMLAGNEQATVTQADLRQPDDVLTAPGVAELLDFTRPVAVLAVAVLDIVGELDAAGLVARYRDACPAGSAIVLSHGERTTLSDSEANRFHHVSAQQAATAHTWRTIDELRQVLDGYDLQAPGLVPTPQWRPEQPIDDARARQFNAYAAVGIIPT